MNGSSVHFGLAAASAALLPLLMTSATLAAEVLVFAMAAALNLLLGYAGLLSFGQGIFFGLGEITHWG